MHLDKESEGAQSFFSFFGYRGAWISEEENAAANAKYREDMKKRRDNPSFKPDEDNDEEDEEPNMEDVMTEIFPEGETLATVFAEDFFPGAIKYFTSAQEADLMSDDGFEDMDGVEEDDEEDEEGVMDLRSLVKGYKGKSKGKVEDVDTSAGQPPKKKRKN